VQTGDCYIPISFGTVLGTGPRALPPLNLLLIFVHGLTHPLSHTIIFINRFHKIVITNKVTIKEKAKNVFFFSVYGKITI
jgi:hypothetical protein